MYNGFDKPKFDMGVSNTNPTPTSKKKDFWTDQISTGGGIAGSLGGAALGASIGSIVPGIGTVIGGLLGGVLGGAGGSGAGQYVENQVTKEKDPWKDVGTEALMGGLFSAPPLRTLKGLGAVGSTLLKSGGETLASGAVKNAFEQAFLKPGVISTVAKNLGGNIASKTYSQAFTVPRKLADQLNPERVSKDLMGYGISGSLDKIGKISNNVMSTLGKVVDNSVSGIGGQIKVGNVTEVANNALKGVAISKSDREALMSTLTDIGSSGVLPGYATPSSLMEVARNLEKKGFARINAGNSALSPNPTTVEIGSAYVQAAKEIEDNIYKQVTSAGSLKGLQTPEIAKQLNSMAKGLGDKFLQAKDIGEIRSLMSPFVRANKLIGLTETQALSAGTQGLGGMTGRIGGGALGFGLGGIPGAAAGFLAEPVVAGVAQAAKAPVATTVGKGIGALSNKITPTIGQATRGIIPTAASQLVGRQMLGQDQGSASLDEALMQRSGGSELFNQQMNPTSQTTQISGQTNAASNPFGVSSEQIGQALMKAYIAGDKTAASQLQSMYDLASKFEQSNASSYKLSQSSKNAMASSDNAINTVDQLEQLFKNAGSGSGRLGGLIQGARADIGWDENAKIYNSLANASVTQIAKALAGSGSGTVSDMDAKVIMNALPTISDTPTEAKAKFAALKQRLQNSRDNTMLYGGGEDTSLQDVLMQQGGY